MRAIHLAKAITFWVGLSLIINACGTSEGVNGEENGTQTQRNLPTFPAWPDVDYYVPESNIEYHELPDGTYLPMVLVPGGSYLMGLNNADPFGIQPSGKVRISVNSFMMGKTPVTNRQYRAFLDALDGGTRDAMMPDSVAWTNEIGVPWGSYFNSEEFADYPVVAVTWEQAQEFASWAGVRLPAESEWEFAARSGVSGRIFPWDGLEYRDRNSGNILANFAPEGDYGRDGYVITSPPGAFPPNNFRLFDMAGNVAEWCEDAYSPSYSALTRATSQLVTPVYRSDRETRRIVRGGSWASSEFFIGVGTRDFRPKDHASPRVGFRVARSVTDPARLMQQADNMPE